MLQHALVYENHQIDIDHRSRLKAEVQLEEEKQHVEEMHLVKGEQQCMDMVLDHVVIVNGSAVIMPPVQFNYTEEWPEVIDFCKQNFTTNLHGFRTTVSLVIYNSKT